MLLPLTLSSITDFLPFFLFFTKMVSSAYKNIAIMLFLSSQKKKYLAILIFLSVTSLYFFAPFCYKILESVVSTY